jgi:hypothetical protein
MRSKKAAGRAFLLILGFCLIPRLSQAWTVNSAVAAGTDTSSALLGVSYFKWTEKPEPIEFESAKASARSSKTKEVAANGSDVTYNGEDISGGIGFVANKHGHVNLDLSHSATREIGYENQGGELSLSWEFSKADGSDDDLEFSPSLEPRVTFGTSVIKQNVDVAVLGRTVSRKIDLRSNSAGLELSAQPFQWLSATVYATKNIYGRSAASLQTALNSKVLNLQAPDFLQTISSLPDHTFGLSFIFSPDREWDILTRFSRSISYADQLITDSISGGPTHRWKNGFSIGVNATYTQIAGAPSELYELNAAYTF